MIVTLNAPYGYVDISFSSEDYPTPKIGESVILYSRDSGHGFKHRVDDVVINYKNNSIDVYFEN